ncbi:MAG: N-acetylmuramoyl-L-alanine amidase [Bacteroidales bacterium]|nr:N-acetylmuramoyl-L-alanine amidase [Bacteroidales bacterium]
MKPLFRDTVAVLFVLFLAIPMPAQKKTADMRLKTVVIDPGHGGKDAGCISRDKKTYEKTITLDIGKRLAQKIAAEYPDVEVKMTRTEDVFVELENRAVFANKAGADLFISIHVNSVEKGTAANGYSIHCLGQSARKGNDLYSKNLDLVKRENSVIMLEDNYETTYQGFDPSDPQSSIIFSLMQNAHLGNSLSFAEDVAQAMGSFPIKNSRGVSQDPFWVLWRTAMPSVLVEVGFITNPGDLSIMRSEKGRDGIATNLFNAFRTFKKRYDSSMALKKEEPAPAVQEPETKQETVSEERKEEVSEEVNDGPLYGVQILATTKKMDEKDPFFAGYKPVMIQSGKIYKYVIATSRSLKEVKAKHKIIQSKFPDNFIVKIEDGKTTPVR